MFHPHVAVSHTQEMTGSVSLLLGLFPAQHETESLPALHKGERFLHEATSVLHTGPDVFAEVLVSVRRHVRHQLVTVASEFLRGLPVRPGREEDAVVAEDDVSEGVGALGHAVLLHDGAEVVQQSHELEGAAVVVVRGGADEVPHVALAGIETHRPDGGNAASAVREGLELVAVEGHAHTVALPDGVSGLPRGRVLRLKDAHGGLQLGTDLVEGEPIRSGEADGIFLQHHMSVRGTIGNDAGVDEHLPREPRVSQGLPALVQALLGEGEISLDGLQGCRLGGGERPPAHGSDQLMAGAKESDDRTGGAVAQHRAARSQFSIAAELGGPVHRHADVLHHRTHVLRVEVPQGSAAHLEAASSIRSVPRSRCSDAVHERLQLVRGGAMLDARASEQVDAEVGIVVLASPSVDEVLVQLGRQILAPLGIGPFRGILGACSHDGAHRRLLLVVALAFQGLAEKAAGDAVGGHVMRQPQREVEFLQPHVFRGSSLTHLAIGLEAVEVQVAVVGQHLETADVTFGCTIVPRFIFCQAHGALHLVLVPSTGFLVEEVEAVRPCGFCMVLGEGVHDHGRAPRRQPLILFEETALSEQRIRGRLKGARVLVVNDLGCEHALPVPDLPLRLPQRLLHGCRESLSHSLADQALPNVRRRIHALNGGQSIGGALHQMHRQGLGQKLRQSLQFAVGLVRNVQQKRASLHVPALGDIGAPRRRLRCNRLLHKAFRGCTAQLLLQRPLEPRRQLFLHGLYGDALIETAQEPHQPRHQWQHL